MLLAAKSAPFSCAPSSLPVSALPLLAAPELSYQSLMEGKAQRWVNIMENCRRGNVPASSFTKQVVDGGLSPNLTADDDHECDPPADHASTV